MQKATNANLIKGVARMDALQLLIRQSLLFVVLFVYILGLFVGGRKMRKGLDIGKEKRAKRKGQ